MSNMVITSEMLEELRKRIYFIDKTKHDFFANINDVMDLLRNTVGTICGSKLDGYEHEIKNVSEELEHFIDWVRFISNPDEWAVEPDSEFHKVRKV